MHLRPDHKGRASLVSVITTPLGFFGLALLIVEGFLGIILIGSNRQGGLNGNQQFAGIWIGSGLFVLIVLIVTILVWVKPQHLTFSESSHIAHDRMTFGDKEGGASLTEKQLENLPKISDEQIMESQ